jgi:hypothetical protein
MEFLADGYPGKREGNDVWAHPLYGVYVLEDYLAQHQENPSGELREGIRTVAEATIDRMDEYRGALVFWYEADSDRGARLYQRHYSGLTQAKYAVQLHRAGDVLDDARFIDAAARVYDSLMIPVDRGGVLMEGPHGPGIAEVPQQPDSWILNGWQSALTSMHRYAELRGSPRVRAFVRKSAETMAAMLPRYDVREVANSRYGLSGFVYGRVLFDQEPERIVDATLEAGDDKLALKTREDASRWESYLFPKDVDGERVKSRSVRANLVVSALLGNRLMLEVEGEGIESATLQLHLGRYDPLSSAPVDPQWMEVAHSEVVDGRVVLNVPDRVLHPVVYPTNFAKKIEGEQVNIYHAIHVMRLRELADATGVEALDEWADQWESYICEWASMSIYEGLKVRSFADPDAVVSDPSAVCDRLG